MTMIEAFADRLIRMERDQADTIARLDRELAARVMGRMTAAAGGK